jgi:hypothetical protein
MRSPNLQRILIIITACSMLAAMILRIGPCGLSLCPSQSVSSGKSDCCGTMLSAGGMTGDDGSGSGSMFIPDFNSTGSAPSYHSGDHHMNLPAEKDESGRDKPVEDNNDQCAYHTIALFSDDPDANAALSGSIESIVPSAAQSGCDDCNCEIKKNTDSEARTASAVPAPDLSMDTGPALTGEVAVHLPVQYPSAKLANRAPPAPGVPAYILFSSLLN